MDERLITPLIRVRATISNRFTFAFCRSKATRWERECKALQGFRKAILSSWGNEKLQAIVKLIFAYSEDALIIKRIDPVVLQDDQLVQLSRMNHNYFGFGDSGKAYRKAALETALRDLTIGNLPNPPELLSRAHSANEDR